MFSPSPSSRRDSFLAPSWNGYVQKPSSKMSMCGHCIKNGVVKKHLYVYVMKTVSYCRKNYPKWEGNRHKSVAMRPPAFEYTLTKTV